MVKVFFSYATSDRDLFQIPQVAELLGAKSCIDVVYYWEESASGSIIEYMNNCVKDSDTCVFFYTKAAASSGPVKKERDMAVYQGKHIIPVFMDINDVPEILQIETGVNASDKTIEEVTNKIYHLIDRKYEDLNRKIKVLIPSLKEILQKKIHVSLKELAREINADLELIKLSLDKFAIHHEDSNELVARGVTDWVYLDNGLSRPATIPDEIINAFFPEGPPSSFPPRKKFPNAPPPPPGKFEMNLRVAWRDLDSVQHVNNAVYLRYIEECGMQAIAAYG